MLTLAAERYLLALNKPARGFKNRPTGTKSYGYSHSFERIFADVGIYRLVDRKISLERTTTCELLIRELVYYMQAGTEPNG